MGARTRREDDAVVTPSTTSTRPRPVQEERPVTVTAYPDGPLVVRGEVEVVGEDGRPVGRPRGSVALCRCGFSGRAPLCDGSHQVAARAWRRREQA